MNETQAFNDLELNISRLIDIPARNCIDAGPNQRYWNSGLLPSLGRPK